MPDYTELNFKELVALFFIALGAALVIYDLITIISGLRGKISKATAELAVKSIRVFTTLLGITLLIAAGIYRNDTLLLFGLVLGLEEFYETSLVLYVLKNAKCMCFSFLSFIAIQSVLLQLPLQAQATWN